LNGPLGCVEPGGRVGLSAFSSPARPTDCSRNKQNGCLPLRDILSANDGASRAKTSEIFLKRTDFRSLFLMRGQAHRLRQTAVLFGERGGGLETPPGTDAVQHGFHRCIESVSVVYLTLADFTTTSSDTPQLLK
jgi:hypothetical protein